jgi:hypothetical protein
LPNSAWCRCCRNAHFREYRFQKRFEAFQKRYRAAKTEAERKRLGRQFSSLAKAAGRILPQPCARCGAKKAEMHHGDYGEPLVVTWLCHRCHMRLHRLRGAQARGAVKRVREAERQAELTELEAAANRAFARHPIPMNTRRV